MIKVGFYDISSSSNIKNNKDSLFVINESLGKSYSIITYKNLINILEFLFPIPTPFEVIKKNNDISQSNLNKSVEAINISLLAECRGRESEKR